MSCCAALFDTVTVMVVDDPVLPAASYAFDCSVCEPFAEPVVAQLHEYGDVVDVLFNAPSR